MKSALFSFIISIVLTAFASAQTPQSQFTKVKLPHGIQVELPKSWWLIGKDYNALIETSAEAVLDLSDLGMHLTQVATAGGCREALRLAADHNPSGTLE